MKTNYLITGGAGFIGSNLADKIVNMEGDNAVYIVDNLSMGKVSNIPQSEKVTFIEGDVTNKQTMTSLLQSVKFDYIFHLAAIASVADSVARPVETHEVNFESVLNLLELIRQYQPGLKRIVFSSSAAVYGDEPTLPKKEESIIRPLTPYAVDKFAAERYVLDYAKLFNVPGSAVRFFNVYGPKQNPASPYSGVLSILVGQYAKLIESIPVSFKMFGDGEQARDFIFVEDVIQALLLVSTSTISIGEVYNVGTGKMTSLNKVIDIMSNTLKVNLPVDYLEGRDGDIKFSLADISKISNLSFEPKFSIERGISKYLKKELNIK